MATFFSIQPVTGGKEKPDGLGSSRVSWGQTAQAPDGEGGGAEIVLEAG